MKGCQQGPPHEVSYPLLLLPQSFIVIWIRNLCFLHYWTQKLNSRNSSQRLYLLLTDVVPWCLGDTLKESHLLAFPGISVGAPGYPISPATHLPLGRNSLFSLPWVSRCNASPDSCCRPLAPWWATVFAFSCWTKCFPFSWRSRWATTSGARAGVWACRPAPLLSGQDTDLARASFFHPWDGESNPTAGLVEHVKY